MRIQHNIMAMGAYRNYTNNLSAMKKNLEKLSSGYKINRAGDDAAGLAISEKMRAQITGLETAQKNAKDGISLVQTAEGALTEVHDMLNRMVTLATQSANGTYDNETDRFQLQKELDQLRSEIDRIADSSNFNGIKLLDGSLSKDGVASISSKFDLPDVGLILGKDTVLHNDEDESAASTAFGVELHNVKFTGEEGSSFTMDIGGTKLTGTLKVKMSGADAANTLTGADMVDSLINGNTDKVEFTDADGNAVDPSSITIDGKEYEIAAGVTDPSAGEKTGLLFKLKNSEPNVNVSMKVSITANEPADPSAPVGKIDGTAETSVQVVAPTGAPEATGNTKSGTVNVDIYKSSGLLDANNITFAKKDGVTASGAAVKAQVLAGASQEGVTETIRKGTADYKFTLDNAAIAKQAGSTLTAGQKITVQNNTSGKFEIKLGATSLAEVTLTAASGEGLYEIKNTTSGEVLGTLEITQTGNAPVAALTDWNTASTDLFNTGMQVAEINYAGLAGSASVKENFTKAALAAGAGSGAIDLAYDEASNELQLKVGNTVVGYADADQLNQGANLTFKAKVGDFDLGSIALTNNAGLSGADLKSLATIPTTGHTYADAKLTITPDPVDHANLANAVKNANINLTDGKVSLKFNGSNSKLYVDGQEITGLTATYTDTSGELKFEDGSSNTLVKLTVSGTVAAANLSTEDEYTQFDDIGITIEKAQEELNTVNSTDLAGANVANLKTASTVAGAKDGDKYTVTYDKGTSKFQLKVGDTVIGTSDASGWTPGTGKGTASGEAGIAGGTLTLKFVDDANNDLGNVTIGNLNNDSFKPEDLQGEIDTGYTFKADPSTAVNADFSGLDSAKLKEFTDTTAPADGSTVQLNYADRKWSLQFSDGTTIAVGTLSADKKSIDFGDYGTVALSKEFDTTMFNAGQGGYQRPTEPMDSGLSYKEEAPVLPKLSGDYLVTTSDQMNTSKTAGDRLASTTFKLTEDMVKDGASIFVAGKNYTFSTGKDTVIRDGAVKVDISDLDSKSADYMTAVAKRLTDAYAADNTGVYTLGWDGDRISVTETMTHGNLKSDGSNDDTYPTGDEWDLRTMEGIAKSLGYSSAPTNGKELTLQIGDTAESFNQLKININDMHTAAMGVSDDDATSIADISIANQADAAKAVDVIKRAINYVSDVRGTLGATQNRLDHTINNLSVMTENIQDAESTIRDTDVADEMMAYTKNNILIQSAQAMLAQANQVPQGVLQLLQ